MCNGGFASSFVAISLKHRFAKRRKEPSRHGRSLTREEKRTLSFFIIYSHEEYAGGGNEGRSEAQPTSASFVPIIFHANGLGGLPRILVFATTLRDKC